MLWNYYKNVNGFINRVTEVSLYLENGNSILLRNLHGVIAQTAVQIRDKPTNKGATPNE
jgi:hypothetical protein